MIYGQSGPHRIDIQDTGAPRGERNYWTVQLNGAIVYKGYNGKEAERVAVRLMNALNLVHHPELPEVTEP